MAADAQQSTQAGEVLLGSLSLLGVALPAASREYGCELCADMFSQPNQKGLNTVLHLLFERILGKEKLKKEFKGVWPVKDTVHQRDFNKVVHGHMLELAAKGVIPRHLAATMLQGFRQVSGPKLTAMLCHLAAHALAKDPACASAQAQLVFQEVPSHPQAAEALFAVVRAQNALQRDAFVAALEHMSAAQAGWDAAAQKLSGDYCAAWQELRGLTSARQGAGAAPEAGAEAAPATAGPAEEALLQAQQQELLVQSHRAADALWLAVKAGAERNVALRARVAEAASAARHPHAVDGGALRAAAGRGGEPGEEVQLAAALGEFATLLAACRDALPEAGEVARLQAQSRALTPLLAPEQLEQVAGIGGQHARRLQGQQEAAGNLRQLLAFAGSQQRALLARVDAALGLAQPQGAAQPGSPAGDLIKAQYPTGEREAVSGEAGAARDAADAGAVPDKHRQHSLGLKAALSLPGPDAARARLGRAAHPSRFEGRAQLLQPFVANIAATILDPSGAVPGLAAAFLPQQPGQRQGVDALKAAHRQAASEALQAATARKSAPPAPPTAAAREPAEPRRLSFSGTTPCTVRSEHALPTQRLEADASTSSLPRARQAADEESVAKLRDRLRQLRAGR